MSPRLNLKLLQYCGFKVVDIWQPLDACHRHDKYTVESNTERDANKDLKLMPAHIILQLLYILCRFFLVRLWKTKVKGKVLISCCESSRLPTHKKIEMSKANKIAIDMDEMGVGCILYMNRGKYCYGRTRIWKPNVR